MIDDDERDAFQTVSRREERGSLTLSISHDLSPALTGERAGGMDRVDLLMVIETERVSQNIGVMPKGALLL